MSTVSVVKLPVPVNEEGRLKSLKELQILDTPAEERFDRITRLARKHFNVPIAALSLVEDRRQWFKSIQGLCANETTREVSFCQYTVMNCSQAVVVNDARADKRFSANPLVTGEPGIVFYAGFPVRGPKGHPIASFCVIDTQPRIFGPDQVESLRDFAALAEYELATQRMSETQRELLTRVGHLEVKAHVDALTRVWNRGAILELLQSELNRAKKKETQAGIIMIDIDHFKGINDTYGHLGGDEALRNVAQEIRGAIRESDSLGRYGGEEFLLVVPGCDHQETADLAERIRFRVEQARPLIAGERVSVTLSIGTGVTGRDGLDPEALISKADARLYQAKSAGRNRVVDSD